MAHMKLFVLLLITTAVLAVDYCNIECPKGKHIACSANSRVKKGLDSACPKGAEIYEFSKTDINQWLKLDNSRRNQIANGSLPGYSSASRMPRTKWNNELATLALYNAQTCKYSHDKCRNTNQYRYAGQNIAEIGTPNKYLSTEEAIQKVHDAWFIEHKDASMETIKKFQKNPKTDIGHFTQIVRDLSPEFGCSAVRYMKGHLYYWYIVCDYGTTNIDDLPIYKIGKACSECEKGCDKDYPALCNSDEPIDPNEFSH